MIYWPVAGREGFKAWIGNIGSASRSSELQARDVQDAHWYRL